MNRGRAADTPALGGIKRPRVLFAGVDWLGDALFSTPALRAIKARHPQAHLAYLAHPRVVPVIARNPHVDQMIPFAEKPALWGAVDWTHLTGELRRGQFDIVFLAHRSLTRVLACAAAGIPRRFGHDYPKRNFWLTDRVSAPNVRAVHRTQIYMSLVESAGIPSRGLEPDWQVRPEDHSRLREQAAEADFSRPFVVLHPGANWDLKRWPVDRFVALASALRRRGFEVWVAGSGSDATLAREVAAVSGVRDICGRTDLYALAALIQSAAALVSADSGPLHLAAALGTPSVGIFGPTDPLLTGPHSRGPARVVHRRYGCEIPCYFTHCEERVCMERLEPDTVLKEVLSVTRAEGRA